MNACESAGSVWIHWKQQLLLTFFQDSMPGSRLGPFEYVGRSDCFRHFSTPGTLAGSDSIPGSDSKLSIFHIRMADIHKKVQYNNVLIFILRIQWNKNEANRTGLDGVIHWITRICWFSYLYQNLTNLLQLCLIGCVRKKWEHHILQIFMNVTCSSVKFKTQKKWKLSGGIR